MECGAGRARRAVALAALVTLAGSAAGAPASREECLSSFVNEVAFLSPQVVLGDRAMMSCLEGASRSCCQKIRSYLDSSDTMSCTCWSGIFEDAKGQITSSGFHDMLYQYVKARASDCGLPQPGDSECSHAGDWFADFEGAFSENNVDETPEEPECESAWAFLTRNPRPGLAPQYGRCGGRSECNVDASCVLCADDGLSCQRINEWHWQCEKVVEGAITQGDTNGTDAASRSVRLFSEIIGLVHQECEECEQSTSTIHGDVLETLGGLAPPGDSDAPSVALFVPSDQVWWEAFSDGVQVDLPEGSDNGTLASRPIQVRLFRDRFGLSDFDLTFLVRQHIVIPDSSAETSWDEPWSGETLEGLPVAFNAAEKIVQVGKDTTHAANVVAGPFMTCRGAVYVVDMLFSGGYEEAGNIEGDEIVEIEVDDNAKTDGDATTAIDDDKTAVADGDETAETDDDETAKSDESAGTEVEVSDGNNNEDIDDPGEFGPGAVNGTEFLLKEFLPED